MLVSLTVGKVDAGVAVLLTEDKRLVCQLHALARQALTITDRVSLHSSPSRHFFRQHSRRQRVSQLQRRRPLNKSIFQATVTIAVRVWLILSLGARSPLPQCYPDFRST